LVYDAIDRGLRTYDFTRGARTTSFIKGLLFFNVKELPQEDLNDLNTVYFSELDEQDNKSYQEEVSKDYEPFYD